MKKKTQSILILLIFFILFAIILGSLWGYTALTAMKKITPQEVYPAVSEGFSLLQDCGEMDAEDSILLRDGQYYIDLTFINENFAGEAFFYQDGGEEVIYTNANTILNFTCGETGMVKNGVQMEGEVWFVRQGQRIYMRMDEARDMFGLDWIENKEYNIISVQALQGQKGVCAVEGTYLKAYPQSGDFIDSIMGHREGFQYYRQIALGETLYRLGEAGGYAQVLTQDGLVGYIQEDAVQEWQEYSMEVPAQPEVEIPEERRVQGKIVMAWHQDYTGRFDASTAELFSNASGIANVISPTWLKFQDNGEVQCLANRDYIDWAHGEGYQVWPLFDNDFEDEKTMAVLQDTEKRQALARELAALCQEYGFDGINVDFEGISTQTGPFFVQFMRELSAVLRPAGYSLSVDCYVPKPWTEHYRRDILGRVADYVIIMGYDEHYAGSEEAGSVASKTFVADGIADTLAQVPAEKTVLGVPFFTRLWTTVESQDGSTTLETEAMGMERALDLAEENGGEMVWRDEIGQYYVEYKMGNNLCQIWLEEERSTQIRLDMAKENGLAGVAAWKIGLERASVWREFQEYVQ